MQSPVLRRGESKCTQCAHKYNKSTEKANIVGQTFEHWEVLEEVEKEDGGPRKFKCRCRSCGAISIKTRAQIFVRKGMHCQKCPPEYHFAVKGDSAVGTLPDGSTFIIDTADIPKVSERWWHKNRRGYVVSSKRNQKPCAICLHEYLLNPQGMPNVIIDHINRNKADCRRSNLRFVTPQQNSMNKSLSKNNRTGYAGVYFDTRSGCYRAKISFNNHNISLGASDNPEECAQMYNVGSELLFRNYAGHHNDVPEASNEIRIKVTEKCLPFIHDADLATRECSLF